MPKGKKLEKSQIEEIKQLKEEYPEMSNVKIARFCGVSDYTVSKVLSGYYDEKPEKKEPEKPEQSGDDVVLAVMELSEQVEKQNALLGAMALALAVVIDPKSGKTSAPVAEMLRNVVRGKND